MIRVAQALFDRAKKGSDAFGALGEGFVTGHCEAVSTRRGRSSGVQFGLGRTVVQCSEKRNAAC